MAITSPTYDPTSTATALAQKYIQPLQDLLDSQTKNASAVGSALTKLQSAIRAFQTSLSSLTGLNKTLYAQSAVLSDTTLGTASATAAAASGTYSFFVEKLATASQVSYSGLLDDGTVGGSIDIKLGSTVAFTVSLSGADTSGDGKLSVRELAAAINKATNNNQQVSASVVTVAGSPQLMLTSTATGVANKVSIDATNMAPDPTGTSTMQSKLSATPTTVVAAQDAVVWLGAAGTGTPLNQASNTFTNIDGVKVTFTKAQKSGDAPVQLTVGYDAGGTAKNVQDFLDAYNTLKSAVDKMVDPGDPDAGVAAGPFAHDAGIRALRDRLVDLMRPTGGSSLALFGITGAKDGTLVLDKDRLNKMLATNPTGLDTLIGSVAANARSGIADKVDTYLDKWSDITTGQIKQRSDANGKLQKDLKNRQTTLDAQYDAAYKRYLDQFTRLQTLQNQMNSNLSIFDALFGNKTS
jgi:flagellar hook-associated protein 2